MSTLLRASDLAHRVVVTLAGEDVAQIKDIVYAANGGEIGSFTLAGRGLFAGPLRSRFHGPRSLLWVPDAVMIESEDVLVPLSEAFDATDSEVSSGKGDILKSEVLTDTGTSLGSGLRCDHRYRRNSGRQADVVGYEIDPAESLGRGKQPLLIPLPDTLAASGDTLMVPASAANYISDNLSGFFGSAIDAFRAQLGGVS